MTLIEELTERVGPEGIEAAFSATEAFFAALPLEGDVLPEYDTRVALLGIYSTIGAVVGALVYDNPESVSAEGVIALVIHIVCKGIEDGLALAGVGDEEEMERLLGEVEGIINGK